MTASLRSALRNALLLNDISALRRIASVRGIGFQALRPRRHPQQGQWNWDLIAPTRDDAPAALLFSYHRGRNALAMNGASNLPIALPHRLKCRCDWKANETVSQPYWFSALREISPEILHNRAFNAGFYPGRREDQLRSLDLLFGLVNLGSNNSLSAPCTSASPANRLCSSYYE